MGIENNIENITGQAKEEIGERTDNPELREEGRNDQASAGVKQKVEEVANKATDAVDKIKDKLNKND